MVFRASHQIGRLGALFVVGTVVVAGVVSARTVLNTMTKGRFDQEVEKTVTTLEEKLPDSPSIPIPEIPPQLANTSQLVQETISGGTQILADTIEWLKVGSLLVQADAEVQGTFTASGTSVFTGSVHANDSLMLAKTLQLSALPNTAEVKSGTGKVLSVDEKGNVILVEDLRTTGSVLPSTSDAGSTLFYNGTAWVADRVLYVEDDQVGINTQPDYALDVLGDAYFTGQVTMVNSTNDNVLELIPTGNTGYLSSNGGALRINNTGNIGSGLGIYSDAGADALGNMINVKVDNPLYDQAAFYMNYDGKSNAVEIVSNSTDSSSNALAVTGNNPNDSTLGIIGYETGKGTVKITHYKNGSDANASGLSIDLKGSGTAAQGIYVDSTETGGTSGNLLRLRNQTVDRFVVNSLGSVAIGGNGTNTSITKHGNVAGDEFFVGTNGAFRVQRSASDSEAFRVQINGDTQGRWLGTSDGKLKWGDGSATADVTLRRSAAQTLLLDGAKFEFESPTTNSDVTIWTASDGSRLGRLLETSGGHGWFEVDNSTGTAAILFRADGGNSYINSGNVGIGTTSFGTSANKVLALGNATAPSTSIADGVQLYAEDVTASSELKVRDEAGNTTTLSPHNFSLIPGGASEELAWSYFSERGDLAINADMTKALRLVESLTGEQLIYIHNTATGAVVSPSVVKRTELTLDDVYGVVEDYVPKKEFQTHVSLTSSIWTFVNTVAFDAQAIFRQSAEFMGSVAFRDLLTVSRDTAGSVVIPAGVTELKVSFSKPYPQLPLVYLFPLQSLETQTQVAVEQLTQHSFHIVLTHSQSKEITINWLAVMREQATTQTEVVHSEPEPTESTAPTASPDSTPKQTSDPTPEPSLEPTPLATPEIPSSAL